MSACWNPFDEGSYYLGRYKFFFNRDELAKFEDPQVTDNFLKKLHPNNYCYVWARSQTGNQSSFPYSRIVDILVGMPEEGAMLIRLRTGLELFDLDTVKIAESNDGSYFMYKE